MLVHWANRKELSNLSFPGVYVLAITRDDVSHTPFSWIPEIVYAGMTNAKGGSSNRELARLDDTVKGGDGHGGGHRVRFRASGLR